MERSAGLACAFGGQNIVSPAQGQSKWLLSDGSVSLLLFKSQGINADLFVFASTALRRGVEIAALSFQSAGPLNFPVNVGGNRNSLACNALTPARMRQGKDWHRSCKRGQENMRRFLKHAAHSRTRLFVPVVEYGLTEFTVTVRQITPRPMINLWRNLRLNRIGLRNIKRWRNYARTHT